MLLLLTLYEDLFSDSLLSILEEVEDIFYQWQPLPVMVGIVCFVLFCFLFNEATRKHGLMCVCV